MKNFTTNFNTEKNKKTGASPVWVVKCPFPGTGTIYLSDIPLTFTTWQGGLTTKPWVKNWGSIDENIAGLLAGSQVADFELNLINDPNVSPNIFTILWTDANNIEVTDCELYLWFRGLNESSDPPVKMWVGNIVDFDQQDELLFNCYFADQTVRLNKFIGNKVTLSVYPNADPDDVGCVQPILYGTLNRIPALALDAGAQTTLPSNISSSVTSFYVSDGSNLANGDVVQVDNEQIYITTISGDQITASTRGYNSTTAVTHLKGSGVWEKKTNFVYLYAGHPVKSIGKIYGVVGDKELDVTSICTKYTGQSGSELSGYSGMAVISVPGYITTSQAVDMLVNDGIAVNDAIAIIDGIAVNDTISVSDTVGVSDGITVSDNIAVGDNIGYTSASTTRRVNPNAIGNQAGMTNPANIYDGNEATAATTTGTTFSFYSKCPATNYGTIVSQTVFVITEIDTVAGNVRIGIGNQAGTSYLDYGVFAVPATGKGAFRFGPFTGAGVGYWDLSIYIASDGGATRPKFYEAWKEVEYSPTLTKTGAASKTGGSAYRSGSAAKTGAATKAGSASKSGSVNRSGSVAKSGTVTLSGNSVANTLIGDKLLVSGEGYKDDASGTFTGTPNALIERPDHIFKHFLNVFLGWATANFSTNAGTQFGTKNYKFSVVINEYRQTKEWLSDMAWQCRCYFRFSNGLAQLLWRPDSLSSAKTITAAMIRMLDDFKTSLKVSRSPLEEVINKIDLHYNRDWSNKGSDPYKSVSSATDATSISRYGEKERPDLFRFDFVSISAMADDLRDFYKNRYKYRKKVISMEAFLDNSEVEFSDPITVAPLSNLLGEVQKANFMPGSGLQARNDIIDLTIREY